MSDELFPELPGLEWGLTKTPIFNTKIMTSVNGRELRASYQAVPKYEISMSFAFLRENKERDELQQLEGFYLDRRGSFDSFLYKMPDDNQFTCTVIGDGKSKKLQLFKSIGSRQELISHTKPQLSEDPLMWNSVSSQKMWSISKNDMWNLLFGIGKDGFVELPTPLALGQQLTISGTFYYRCRFKDDEQQYTNFMSKLWKASKVEIIGSLGKKI
ncbi:DUF2460 domain-containing protein [Acinetobacter bereziniae]|uniref:DUF2460 domain-containing protein n=1 Tax=Acinetobacter bereziniae TaxID=106648 RepID=UPI003018C882